MLFSLTIEHFCCPLFTNKKNNMRANYAKWLISGQTATKEDRMAEKKK